MIEWIEYDETVFVIYFSCNPSPMAFDIKYYNDFIKAWDQYHIYREVKKY